MGKHFRQRMEARKSASRNLLVLVVIAALTAVTAYGVAVMGKDSRRKAAAVTADTETFLQPVRAYKGSTTRDNELYPFLPALVAELQKYFADPQIGTAAKKVVDRIGEYDKLLREQFPFASGLNIDYIGIYHIGGNNNDPAFLRSQREQNRLLQKYPYQLIGWEGGSSDTVTWDTLVDEAEAEAKLMGVPVSRQALKAAVRKDTKLDGVLVYYEEHPTAKLTGLEDPILLDLNVAIQEASKVSDARDKQLEHLTGYVITARSLIGTARVIRQMRLQNLHSAVIVMGQGHATHFDVIFEALGTNSRIFEAI